MVSRRAAGLQSVVAAGSTSIRDELWVSGNVATDGRSRLNKNISVTRVIVSQIVDIDVTGICWNGPVGLNDAPSLVVSNYVVYDADLRTATVFCHVDAAVHVVKNSVVGHHSVA